MITLINKQKRMRVFNLDHPTFDDCSSMMPLVVIEESRDGQRLPRRIRKKVCGSLTLTAGEKRHGFPDQIVKVPQIEQAIRAGTLQALKVGEVKPAATPAATKATTVSTAAAATNQETTRRSGRKR